VNLDEALSSLAVHGSPMLVPNARAKRLIRDMRGRMLALVEHETDRCTYYQIDTRQGLVRITVMKSQYGVRLATSSIQIEPVGS